MVKRPSCIVSKRYIYDKGNPLCDKEIPVNDKFKLKWILPYSVYHLKYNIGNISMCLHIKSTNAREREPYV